METSPNSELSRPRRWKSLILIPTLAGLLGGYLVSHLFEPKYTSQSMVLVEGQKIPAAYVQPLITSDFTERIQTLALEVLSASRLGPMIGSLNLVRPEEEGKLIENIQANMSFTPMITPMTQAATTTSTGAKKELSLTDEPVPGFNVSYSDSTPERAQKICNALTSMIVDENLRARGEVAKGTEDFLDRQVHDAKHELTEMGRHLQLFELHRKGASRSAEDEAQRAAYEAEQKLLALDYDIAQKNYTELLGKLFQARTAVNMEYAQESEQMTILQTANLPTALDFPDRPLFAFGGLCTGLALGIALALWQRFRPQAHISEEPISGARVSEAPATSPVTKRPFFSRLP